MKKLFFISSFLFFIFGLKAQNWNAFHAGYRYNYKIDGSNLISNVLFSDSIKVNGTDSIYFMNRIGVPCNGTCPTITGTVPVGAVAINMPQFLQRKIIQKPGGIYFLHDTARFVISTLSNPGQSWLFDTLGAVSASCVSKMQTNTFGQNDSIKNIILSTGDSIVLSYSFGILKFPEPFSKNKYFRLVGIENASSYDSTALHGQKVPNAWDFYRFTTWTHFCTYRSFNEPCATGSHSYRCYDGKIIYSNLSSNGLKYNYNTQNSFTVCGSSGPNTFGNTDNYWCYGLNSLSGKSLENIMYPGRVVSSGYWAQFAVKIYSYPDPVFNIVKFATDTLGNFVKYAGPPCSELPSIQFLKRNIISTGLVLNSSQLAVPHYQGYVSEVFVVGMGRVSSRYWATCVQYDDCIGCAADSNGTIIGHENEVGINETAGANKMLIYPNPVQEKITLKTDGYQSLEISITDAIGREVINKIFDWKPELEIDLSELVAGIYIIRVSSNGICIGTEKISKY